MPVITLEQTGDADVERGGDFSLFTRTADAELRERGLFIGESLKVIERAMVAGAVPRAMLLPEKLLEDTMPVIKRALAADASTPIYVAPKALFKEITGYEVVRSALAVFERPSLPNATELLDSLGARRVAVLEDIGNSTNIGAIFRSAAALGVDAVLVTPSCHDPLSAAPPACRWVRCSRFPGRGSEAFSLGRGRGFRSFTTWGSRSRRWPCPTNPSRLMIRLFAPVRSSRSSSELKARACLKPRSTRATTR